MNLEQEEEFRAVRRVALALEEVEKLPSNDRYLLTSARYKYEQTLAALIAAMRANGRDL